MTLNELIECMHSDEIIVGPHGEYQYVLRKSKFVDINDDDNYLMWDWLVTHLDEVELKNPPTILAIDSARLINIDYSPGGILTIKYRN